MRGGGQLTPKFWGMGVGETASMGVNSDKHAYFYMPDFLTQENQCQTTNTNIKYTF